MSASKFIDVEVKFDYTKEQIIEMIKAQTGYDDAVVDFDVSPKGQVRGVTIRIKRRQIEHGR